MTLTIILYVITFLLFVAAIGFVIYGFWKKKNVKRYGLLSFIAGLFALVFALKYTFTEIVKPVYENVVVPNATKAADAVSKKIEEAFPDAGSPYRHTNIDPYYWVDNWEGYPIIPLVEPISIGATSPYSVLDSEDSWFISWDLDHNIENVNGNSIKPLLFFNYMYIYVYGYKEERSVDWQDGEISIYPAHYFVLDTKNRILHKYEDEVKWEQALDSLELPKKYYEPEEIYQKFRNNPILPWFPEEIKQQLREAKETFEMKN